MGRKLEPIMAQHNLSVVEDIKNTTLLSFSSREDSQQQTINNKTSRTLVPMGGPLSVHSLNT